MNKSILSDVKQSLSITPDCDAFDTQLIMDINSVLSTLEQIGVEVNQQFVLTDKSNTWNEFLIQSPNVQRILNFIKYYVSLKVRIIFDPPNSSSLVESINRQISEMEWRIDNEIRQSNVVIE